MNESILIISELDYPEETSTGYFVTGIAEGLAGSGFAVLVLCAQPPDSQRVMRAPVPETRGGVFIERLPAPRSEKNKLWGLAAPFFCLLYAFYEFMTVVKVAELKRKRAELFL